MKPRPDDWITTKEALKLLGIGRSCFWIRVKLGFFTPCLTVPAGKKHIKTQYWSRTQVEANRGVNPVFPPKQYAPYLFRPTREEVAYLAGLFDGEGCITIVHGNGRDNFVLNVHLANTHRPVLEWVAERFGGRVHDRKPFNERCRPCSSWHVGQRKALSVLRLIEPFLIVKQEQARLAIQFQETIIRRTCSTRHSLTPDEMALRQSMHDRMAALNKRGPR